MPLHWDSWSRSTRKSTIGLCIRNGRNKFFVANGITDDAKKVAILLTVIGRKAYALLRNLLAPAKPAEKSFDVLVKVMKDHLKPKPLVIAERFKFHRRNQHGRETVAQYLAELRKFSKQCDFKEHLEEALRDRLVCGLRSEVVQRRLLAGENLTLKKAQELALGIETAAKNVCELQGTRRAAEPRLQRDVCRVQREVTNDCYKCGKQNHKSAQCPFRTTMQVSQLWQSGSYKESLQTTKETTHFSREIDTKAPCQDSAKGN